MYGEQKMRETILHKPLKTPPKAVKKIKKPTKAKTLKRLGNSKSLIGVVTFNDISPV
jgi:hypothetical protein